MNMDMYGNSDTPELTNQQKAAVRKLARFLRPNA